MSGFRGRLGGYTYQQRYSERPLRGERSAAGEASPCDHVPGTCDVRELWPYPGETQEQFKARLRAKYNWPAMAQEATTS